VDSRPNGIKMRLRGSHCKFPVYNEEDAEFEIAGSFVSPNPVHLSHFVFPDFNCLFDAPPDASGWPARPMVMVLEDRGVRKEAFLIFQMPQRRKFTSRRIL
jgi:hypothetical protein